MSLEGKKIGVAFTGSFCTYKKVFEELKKLVDAGAEVQTIFSNASQTIDSRFGKAADFVADAEKITGIKPMMTINEKPLVVSVSTNDALGMNMKNIGLLLNAKHIYFVPFGQDDPVKKPNSMVAHTELLIPAVEAALQGWQYQPIIQ